MLLIYEVTSARNAKHYYAGSVSASPVASRQDYYSEGQENIGRYGGKLGERLGIAGQVVDKASFDRLCDNWQPLLDAKGKRTRLTPRTNESRRVAYDFTFSGPKSFSVLQALASEEVRQELLRLFDEAATETMCEEIEPEMLTRNRQAGADEDRITGNMLWAGFDHATARPEHDPAARVAPDVLPDPHWHKHVVVFNATYEPVENRIKAGQFGDLKRDGEAYRAEFYSRLAGKLEAAGFVVDRRGGMEWEIAGVPRSLIDRFSKRTHRIDGEAEKQGITDGKRKAELGAKTRGRKQTELTMPELRTAWDAQLNDAERDALAAVYRKEIASGPEVTAAQAVSFAIAHCREQQSVIPERELRRVALMHGLGQVSSQAIVDELPRHGVIVREIDGRRMATTKELVSEERYLAGFAGNGRGAVTPVGVPPGLDRGKLNDAQWQTVVGLLQSSNRLSIIQGPAGSGKSWSLKKLDEGMRLAGRRVTFLATTTDAVENLVKDGFADTKTLAHFLLSEKAQNAAKDSYVVLDETSLLGHGDAVRFFRLAEKLNLKLILVGDAMQHGSVARGATMRLLEEYAGVQPFRLTEIRRQTDAEYHAAATLLSQGKSAEGFDLLQEKGWVKEMADDAERYRAIAAEYLTALHGGTREKDVLIISPTHREAGLITQEIRSQLRAAGLLGKEERQVTRLVAVNASEAERGQASTYRVGDVIQFHQNAKGFTKGDRLTVTDPAGVPLAEASKFQLFRPEAMPLSINDRVRFTAGVKTADGKHTLRNGSMGTIAGFTAKGDIKLANGWVIPADAGHLRAGLVDTSFAAQGKTVRKVILGMASQSLGATNQEQLYVSASRAKEKLTLYTDDKAAVRGGIQRSSAKLTALDLVSNRPDASDRLRKLMAKQRRVKAIRRVRAAWTIPMTRNQPERQVGYGR